MTPAAFLNIRDALNLSQAKLAKRLGLATYTVQRYEYGALPVPRPVELLMLYWGQDAPKPGTRR